MAVTTQPTGHLPEPSAIYGAPPNPLLFFGAQFRRRRHNLLLEWLDSLRLPRPYKLLDLRGTPGYWRHRGLPAGAHVLCVNLDSSVTSDLPQVEMLCVDATRLAQYAKRSFDVVFSNSLIGHLYTFERQQSLSQEIQRVGLHYFVQTPNRRFFLEPHFYRYPSGTIFRTQGGSRCVVVSIVVSAGQSRIT